MSEQIFDLPELMERVQDDKELLLELIDIFTEDFKQKRIQLQKAVEEKAFDDVGSIAHSLKGASGNISAKDLRESLLILEKMGKDSDLTGVEDLLKVLDEKFAQLEQRLSGLEEELQ